MELGDAMSGHEKAGLNRLAQLPTEDHDALTSIELDAARYRFLRNQQSWGNVIYEAIGYGGGEDFDKAIDATMGFTPQELSPALHSDDELRKTEGYRLGFMEGMPRKQVNILQAAAERQLIAEPGWFGIWDAAPVQGENVLATDGKTVIAARWFAPGWAEYGDSSDEIVYLDEGWVTHWQPFPSPSAHTAIDIGLA